MDKVASTREHLILFARPPLPGQAKTRLAPILGDDGAAALYQAFLKDAAAMANAVRNTRPSVGLNAEWALEDSLPCELPLASWMPGPFLHQEQPKTHLGHRMATALGRRLASGARAVLVGTDFPDLPPEIPVAAFEALEQMDQLSSKEGISNAVIGPSNDGGYYLIGLSQPAEGLFVDIPWGTNRVFGRTLEKLKELSIPFHVLPYWDDVDTPDDLQALQLRIQQQPATIALQTRDTLGRIFSNK
jgi:rSAM/selenodomain-associated transferase 1